MRERIEDSSPESLARFNVRWIVGVGRSPSLGEPATERRFGSYRVRELPAWDGAFARIERGTGTVRVLRLDDEAVEITVDAPGPVLVALGTGYYPRWRARHESGADEPVFALPSIPGGTLHVVAAWVAPGRTVFTCDAALPSDGRGRLLSLAAALFAIAAIIVWSRPRWRTRVLRRFVWVRSQLRARSRRALALLVPALLLALVTYGLATAHRAQKAVLVGSSGIRPSATVEARFVGTSEWQTCGFSPVTGSYRCPDLVTVADETVNMINDALPSWPFITPAIAAHAETALVELRITRTLHLGGRYWLGATAGTVELLVDGEVRHPFAKKSTIELPRGEHTVQLTTRLPDSAALHIVFVDEDALVPRRTFLVAPPDQPPASVSAIAK